MPLSLLHASPLAFSLSEILAMLSMVPPPSFHYNLHHLSILLLPRQRQPRARTNIQFFGHLIQQPLILNPLPTLQQLDICEGGINGRRQLLLRKFIRVFRAAGADGVAEFRAGFLRNDNIV